MKRAFVLLAGITFLALGCEAKNEKAASPGNRVYRSETVEGRAEEKHGVGPAAGQLGPVFMAQAPNQPVKGDEKKQPEPAAPPKPESPARKIIYTGTVELVVPDLDAATQGLQKLIDAHKGFIAHADVRGTKGERRTGTWTIRIPAEEHPAMMEALSALGETTSVHTDTQDVSEEYYDVEARLKNKQVEEKRLLEHLQKSTGKLEDILAVEKELSRVREEIERFQGRLNKLANLTALTTITVNMQEIKDYVPPTSPTFRTSIGRTFGESADTLGAFLRNVVLFVVAIVPWLPFLAIIIGVPLWAVRRWLRQLPATRNP